jgi:DNA-binding NarL/FixJ family response regulator
LYDSGGRVQLSRKAALSMRESRERTAVVLDEQPLWLEAMESLLEGVGLRVVGKATDVSEALALVVEHRPDVLVLDLDLRGAREEALGCIRKARASYRDLRVVALASDARSEEVEAAFEAGAGVFCVKTASPEDVSSAIRQVFDSSVYVALTGRAATAVAAPPTDAGTDLTRRELEILRLVAEGYSNSELAKMLWVTEQTVKFHLSNIYRKLDVANRTEASRWAQIHGLLPAQMPSAAISAA